jgi:hypothetical protein
MAPSFVKGAAERGGSEVLRFVAEPLLMRLGTRRGFE